VGAPNLPPRIERELAQLRRDVDRLTFATRVPNVTTAAGGMQTAHVPWGGMRVAHGFGDLTDRPAAGEEDGPEPGVGPQVTVQITETRRLLCILSANMRPDVPGSGLGGFGVALSGANTFPAELNGGVYTFGLQANDLTVAGLIALPDGDTQELVPGETIVTMQYLGHPADPDWPFTYSNRRLAAIPF
jgi:hypothetical protein